MMMNIKTGCAIKIERNEEMMSERQADRGKSFDSRQLDGGR